MSLSAKAARGGIVVLFGQGLKVFLQVINLIVLARMLTPEDFGLVAMVVAIYGVCDILLDFGLSTASIQAAEVSKKQISNLLWINVLIGFALTLISYHSAHFLSVFYERSELLYIAQVMSLGFIFNGISAQYKASLNRALQFNKMVFADIVASLAGITIGIYMAWLDFSYWAVVTQLLIQSFVQMIMYIIFGRWLPSLPDRNVNMRGFFKFGWGLVGSQLLAYFSSSAPAMLIGRQIGAIDLGLYDRANKLLTMPLNQINAPLSSVALPILSRLHVEDQNKYNKFLLFGQNIVVHIVVSILAILSCQTDEIVSLILGNQWRDMVSVFIGLSFAGVFLVLSYTSYWVFLTKGLTSSLFKMGLIGRPVVILITSLGLIGGSIGVAYGYSLGLLFQWLLGVFWLRNTGVPIRKMILRPIIISFCYFSSAHISNYFINHFMYQNSNTLVLGWVVMFTVLLIQFFMITPFRESVLELFELKKYVYSDK